MDKHYFVKTDTQFFKGIAIIMIILHNYMHLLEGFGLENESSFKQTRFLSFLELISSFSLHNIVTALFAFLGHYGVQLFIFFSAYGLSIIYQKSKSSDLNFILKRLKKIYFLLAFAIIFFIAFRYFRTGSVFPKSVVIESFLMGSTISSFFDIYLYKIFSGPYWFFPLIIQLYILFPFLYKIVSKFEKKNLWLLFALVYILIIPLHFFTASNQFTLFGNIFGHLPEVLLGIIMVQHRFISFKNSTIIFCFLLFVSSQYFEFLFPFSFLTMTILLLSLFSKIENIMGKRLKDFVLYIGKISMILFIVNGPLRALSIFRDADDALIPLRILLFLPILLVLSHLLFLIYDFLIKKLKI